MESTPVIVGIDVAKDKVNYCALPKKEEGEIPAGQYPQLAKQLVAMKPDLIVIEATGGYERNVVAALAEHDLPIAVVNPSQVRSYAKGVGFKAKTDPIDAFVLARFGHDAKPQPNVSGVGVKGAIRDMLARRRQLIGMHTAEKNRAQQAASKRVARSIQHVLKVLEKELKRLEAEIDDYISSSPEWSEKREIMKSVPGVGEHTAHAMLVEFPELGTLTREQAASLAGLAPMNRDSGKYRGGRHICGGRSAVRSALYMATLTARCCNPVIRVFYERLRAAGKLYKVAMTACMRKLLLLLNSLLKQNIRFIPKTA